MHEDHIIGKTLGDMDFLERVGPDWWERDTDYYFADKKVLIFGLPGAFTPTCSTKQLPEYEQMYTKIKEAGNLDEIYCTSVNDAFVMNAWREQQGVEKVKFINDGNHVLSDEMGVSCDFRVKGFDTRSWRYAAIVDNKVVKNIWIEDGYRNPMGSRNDDPYEVSSPQYVMEHINDDYETAMRTLYARRGLEYNAAPSINDNGLTS